MLTIIYGDRELFPVAGAIVRTSDGSWKRIVGLFASEQDAISEDADRLAIAIVSLSDLSKSEQAVALANSEAIPC